MIENDKMRLGGNTLKIWLGTFLVNLSNKLSGKVAAYLKEWGESSIDSGRPKYVTNPAAKFYNPFTLVVAFTFDTTQKYQIVLQGDYKQQYKKKIKEGDDSEEGESDLSTEQMFMIISQHRKEWFRKD